MSKKRIFNNVNILGNFYLDNPENIPERSFLTGPGTDRPVGFFPSQFARLFWRHRSFSGSAFAVLPIDLFTNFLVAGGTTGGIVGSLTGLTIAQQAGGGIAGFSAKTRVSVNARSKIRVTLPGINNGITQGKAEIIGTPKDPKSQNPLNLDNKIKNILSSFRNDVNEGSTSIGSYHFGQSSTGFFSIDFSDVAVIRSQYWPRIVLMFGPSAGNNGPAFSSVLRLTSLDGRPERDMVKGGPWNTPIIGGVVFDGAFIQMYGNNNYSLAGGGGVAIVNGNIAPDISNACSTMNWDTFEDSARDGYKEDDCKKVFREDRNSSSSST